MIRTAAAVAILGAAAALGQIIDLEENKRIHRQKQAQSLREQYLRQARDLDVSYRNCQQSEQRKKHPNPHNCEKFRIQADARRAQAGAVRIEETPMYANYDPYRAATRRYPVGQRPDAPPPLMPGSGQVARGVLHGLQTGQTSFEEDPGRISGRPALDYRGALGGNAGTRNGRSAFGAYDRPSFHPRPQYHPRPQMHPRPQYQPRTQTRRGQPAPTGRYSRGRIVD